MRLIISIFLTMIATIVQSADGAPESFAFLCTDPKDGEEMPVILQEIDGDLIAISKNGERHTEVMEVAPEVFEFSYPNPTQKAYLRQVDAEWKFLASDAGIVDAFDCQDVSEMLRLSFFYMV